MIGDDRFIAGYRRNRDALTPRVFLGTKRPTNVVCTQTQTRPPAFSPGNPSTCRGSCRKRPDIVLAAIESNGQKKKKNDFG